jgi:uncharacterized RDD family membrane protein YckC
MSDGAPINPYAPPVADAAAQDTYAAPSAELASLGQRFGGAIVDGLVHACALLPVYLEGNILELLRLAGRSGNPLFLYTHTGTAGVVAAALVLAVLGMQAILLTTRGQSIGKIVAGSRVVLTNGARAPFVNVVVLRLLPVWLIPLIPKANGVLSLVDVLFVFGEQRRCLHDRVAGTKVVRARAPS